MFYSTIPESIESLNALKRLGEKLIILTSLSLMYHSAHAETYLAQEEIQLPLSIDILASTRQPALSESLVTSPILLVNLCASWSCDDSDFRLQNLSCQFENGLNLVYGSIGSGKSLLLLGNTPDSVHYLPV